MFENAWFSRIEFCLDLSISIFRIFVLFSTWLSKLNSWKSSFFQGSRPLDGLIVRQINSSEHPRSKWLVVITHICQRTPSWGFSQVVASRSKLSPASKDWRDALNLPNPGLHLRYFMLLSCKNVFYRLCSKSSCHQKYVLMCTYVEFVVDHKNSDSLHYIL